MPLCAELQGHITHLNKTAICPHCLVLMWMIRERRLCHSSLCEVTAHNEEDRQKKINTSCITEIRTGNLAPLRKLTFVCSAAANKLKSAVPEKSNKSWTMKKCLSFLRQIYCKAGASLKKKWSLTCTSTVMEWGKKNKAWSRSTTSRVRNGKGVDVRLTCLSRRRQQQQQNVK